MRAALGRAGRAGGAAAVLGDGARRAVSPRAAKSREVSAAEGRQAAGSGAAAAAERPPPRGVLLWSLAAKGKKKVR